MTPETLRKMANAEDSIGETLRDEGDTKGLCWREGRASAFREVAAMLDAESELQPGQHVTTSGYPGCIVRRYSPGMYEVRLASGLVCVDRGDIQATP